MKTLIVGAHRLFLAITVIGLFLAPNASAQLVRDYNQKLCSSRIPHHFQAARDSVIRVWTVLDILRSVTIEPQDRVRFAEQILEDMLAILTSINALSCSCEFCGDYCRQKEDDIVYLEELLVNLSEAFRAVFDPLQNGEEQMAHTVLLKTADMLDLFKDQVARSQSLN